MQLLVNGEKKEIANIKTVQDLLVELGYETESVAIACNNTFISRSKYNERQLQEGEELEILVPMQGG